MAGVTGTGSVEFPRGDVLESRWDAERGEPAHARRVRRTTTESRVELSGCTVDSDGALLVRTYDAAQADQEAEIWVGNRRVGKLFEAYANPNRRFAQTALWIDLAPGDCVGDKLPLRFNARGSSSPWSEIRYDVRFFSTGQVRPAITQNQSFTRIFDTRTLTEAPQSGPHYVNDHSMIRDAQGKWHLYGIFHQDPFLPGDENDFVHATTVQDSRLADPAQWSWDSFEYTGIALRTQPRIGETHIWAPHIVRDGDRYIMAYHAGGPDNHRVRMQLAESRDLATWTRLQPTPTFEDICMARDPMLRKQGTLWIMYYTRCDARGSEKSGVAYRTSFDLVTWSAPAMALTLTGTPSMFNSGYTESPFVFERGGWFYLSVTSYPIDWDASFVYRSRSPFHFEPTPIARLRTHAPEWVAENDDFERGDLFVTHCGPGQGGVWLSAIDGL